MTPARQKLWTAYQCSISDSYKTKNKYFTWQLMIAKLLKSMQSKKNSLEAAPGIIHRHHDQRFSSSNPPLGPNLTQLNQEEKYLTVCKQKYAYDFSPLPLLLLLMLHAKRQRMTQTSDIIFIHLTGSLDTSSPSSTEQL